MNSPPATLWLSKEGEYMTKEKKTINRSDMILSQISRISDSDAFFLLDMKCIKWKGVRRKKNEEHSRSKNEERADFEIKSS